VENEKKPAIPAGFSVSERREPMSSQSAPQPAPCTERRSLDRVPPPHEINERRPKRRRVQQIQHQQAKIAPKSSQLSHMRSKSTEINDLHYKEKGQSHQNETFRGNGAQEGAAASWSPKSITLGWLNSSTSSPLHPSPRSLPTRPLVDLRSLHPPPFAAIFSTWSSSVPMTC
jgi:hypothetical protein